MFKGLSPLWWGECGGMGRFTAWQTESGQREPICSLVLLPWPVYWCFPSQKTTDAPKTMLDRLETCQSNRVDFEDTKHHSPASVPQTQCCSYIVLCFQKISLGPAPTLGFESSAPS